MNPVYANFNIRMSWNSISSYQDDERLIMKEEKLCSMEICLQLRRFRLERGSNSGLKEFHFPEVYRSVNYNGLRAK